MEIQKLTQKLENYERALNRLREVVQENNINEYVYDSAIQRFEFTFELAWKSLKALINYKGQPEVKFPRDVFKEAFSAGLIDEQEVWLSMINDRNITSHTYDEEDLLSIYTRIKDKYFFKLEQLFFIIKGEIKE